MKNINLITGLINILAGSVAISKYIDTGKTKWIIVGIILLISAIKLFSLSIRK